MGTSPKRFSAIRYGRPSKIDGTEQPQRGRVAWRRSSQERLTAGSLPWGRMTSAMCRRLPRRKSHLTHPVHSSQQTHTTDTTNNTTTTTTINQPPPSPRPDDPTVSSGHACVHMVRGGTGCAAEPTTCAHRSEAQLVIQWGSLVASTRDGLYLFESSGNSSGMRPAHTPLVSRTDPLVPLA